MTEHVITDSSMPSHVKQYYLGAFGSLLVVLLVLRAITSSWISGDRGKSAQDAGKNAAFKGFQRVYIIVYLVMMAADWLQGPYVYALYKHYGFNQGQIGQLFIAGFGSSFLFGTVAGTMADKYGRKAMCVAFGVIYFISCLTKHSSDFSWLMFGRVVGGVSTSILFSAFESWMVHEHHQNSYPDDWLSLTFSIGTTGNGIVAIAAGIAGQYAKDHFGPVAPFNLSMVLLTIGTIIVLAKWSENYGNSEVNMSSNLSHAWTKLRADPRIMLLGVIQSLFEGAMYVFVFMWTPALESTSKFDIYHGWIFASLMISVLIGSTIFNALINLGYKVERFAVFVFVVASVALFIPAVVMQHTVRLACFFVFEMCCGMFWPCLGTLRGKYVPEDVRATTMNLFRMPLNFIVVSVLYNIEKLSERNVFFLCAFSLAATAFAQYTLKSITVDAPTTPAAKLAKKAKAH